MGNIPTNSEPTLESATVYLLTDHQIILEELKLKLRRHGHRVTKSELVRLAIEGLQKQSLDQVLASLTAKPTR